MTKTVAKLPVKAKPSTNGAIKTRTKRTAKAVEKPVADPTKFQLPPNYDVNSPLALLVKDLCELQRKRTILMKSRNMQTNRLRAIIACQAGYTASQDEAERKKRFKEASIKIKAAEKGDYTGIPFPEIVRVSIDSIKAFEQLMSIVEKDMKKKAELLPVAKWAIAIRGVDYLTIASIVGETGDLSLYANPAKVWKRMGCAPWQYDGQTFMGGTWRRGVDGKLPAEEWVLYGYSPRRRSIMFNIGKNMVMANKDGDKDGVYRTRYLEAKALFAKKHPDYKPLRCDLHGTLCAAKMLLRDLWVEWNGHPPKKGL